MGNQSGTSSSETLYSFEVPAGTRLFNLMTYGGTGNASVYVSAGEAPTAAAFDYKSTRPGNTETVRVSNPQAAIYYILVTGSYTGMTIQARAD